MYCVSPSVPGTPFRSIDHHRCYSLRWLVPLVVLDEVRLHGALDALAVLVAVDGVGRLELVGESVGAYPADEAVLQLVDVLGRLLHHLHLHVAKSMEL